MGFFGRLSSSWLFRGCVDDKPHSCASLCATSFGTYSQSSHTVVCPFAKRSLACRASQSEGVSSTSQSFVFERSCAHAIFDSVSSVRSEKDAFDTQKLRVAEQTGFSFSLGAITSRIERTPTAVFCVCVGFPRSTKRICQEHTKPKLESRSKFSSTTSTTPPFVRRNKNRFTAEFVIERRRRRQQNTRGPI